MKVGRLDQKSCYLSVVAQASPATLPAAKTLAAQNKKPVEQVSVA